MAQESLLKKSTSVDPIDILNMIYLKAEAPQLASAAQRRGDDMAKAGLFGQTILVVQSKIDKAIPLQNRIVQDGGRVLTAYSPSRALLIATSAELSGAVIDTGMTGADQIISLLKTRNVPYIVD